MPAVKIAATTLFASVASSIYAHSVPCIPRSIWDVSNRRITSHCLSPPADFANESRLSWIKTTEILTSCKSDRARDAASLARLGVINPEGKSAVNQRADQGRGQKDKTENPEQPRMQGLA